MKIKDLIPKKSQFTASITDQVYHLRPATVGDVHNISNNIIEVDKFLMAPLAEDICKVAFVLMTDESREHFLKRTVCFIDIEGNKKEEQIGGYVLLMNVIKGINEQLELYRACLISFGFDDSFVDKTKEISLEEAQKRLEDVKEISKKKE